MYHRCLLIPSNIFLFYILIWYIYSHTALHFALLCHRQPHPLIHTTTTTAWFITVLASRPWTSPQHEGRPKSTSRALCCRVENQTLMMIENPWSGLDGKNHQRSADMKFHSLLCIFLHFLNAFQNCYVHWLYSRWPKWFLEIVGTILRKICFWNGVFCFVIRFSLSKRKIL